MGCYKLLSDHFQWLTLEFMSRNVLVSLGKWKEKHAIYLAEIHLENL